MNSASGRIQGHASHVRSPGSHRSTALGVARRTFPLLVRKYDHLGSGISVIGARASMVSLVGANPAGCARSGVAPGRGPEALPVEPTIALVGERAWWEKRIDRRDRRRVEPDVVRREEVVELRGRPRARPLVEVTAGCGCASVIAIAMCVIEMPASAPTRTVLRPGRASLDLGTRLVVGRREPAGTLRQLTARDCGDRSKFSTGTGPSARP